MDIDDKYLNLMSSYGRQDFVAMENKDILCSQEKDKFTNMY